MSGLMYSTMASVGAAPADEVHLARRDDEAKHRWIGGATARPARIATSRVEQVCAR